MSADCIETNRSLYRARAIVALVFFVVLIPAICTLALSLNRNTQEDALKQDTAILSRELAVHLSELETLMSALLGMHYAGTHDSPSNLVSLTSQLQSRLPIIDGIGRFARVPLSGRDDFEVSMNEQGLYDFHIVDITKAGREIAKKRSISLPIAALQPMSPALVGLLGSDLAATPDIFLELERAVRSNRATLIQAPQHWPSAGRLLFFKPTYRGMHPPKDEAGRVSQADGGYLMIINPQGLLIEHTENTPHIGVSIELDNALGTEKIYAKAATEIQGLPTKIGLKELKTIHTFFIGPARFTLTVSSKIGILLPNLLYTVLIITALGFCLIIVRLYVENRTRAQQDRIRSREKLYIEQKKAARTLDAISDAVITVDNNAKIQHVNPAGARMLNGSASSLFGKHFDALLPLRHIDRLASRFVLADSLRKMGDSGRTGFELTILDDSSSGTVLSATLSRITDSAGVVVGCTVILRDTSAETKLRQALEYQANHDALTGCTNRHYFENRLTTLLGPQSDHKNYALLYVDLDQFKIVNDTAGHGAGDELLINITARLSKFVRVEDTLSRIGGDEFGLILGNVTKEEAIDACARICNMFDTYIFTHHTHTFPVTASIGLVHFSEVADSAADVLAAADMACYAAKDGGRNQLFVYSADDETMAERSDELSWLTRLRHALDNNLFQLHAQPLANLKRGGSVTHFEFLLRLVDESGLEITPWQIIQAAERYGLMRDLDRWIIARAMQTVSELEGFDQIGFSINLSGQSAADPTLVDFIEQQYEIHQVNPANLCFEITETAAISNYGTAIELITAIQSLGSKVALDDFGSGVSSFGYLKTLPVDILKIDGQFVRNLASSSIDRAMVKAIQDVAKSMKLITVAEFVENADIVSFLESIGIDYAQGYHIAQPLPLEKALLLAQSGGENHAADAA